MLGVIVGWEDWWRLNFAVHDFADGGFYGANIVWLIEEGPCAVSAVASDAGWWGNG